MAKNIVSLELDFRDNTTQESSVVMTIADTMITANIIADAVILANMSIANDSCA